MGSNIPKSDLDAAYRLHASAFLEALMMRRQMKIGELAKALGVDRSVASRYLGRQVRPPLQRLLHIERSLPGEEIPEALKREFYDSDASGPPTIPAHAEALHDEIEGLFSHVKESDLADPDKRAEVRRELESLLQKLR